MHLTACPPPELLKDYLSGKLNNEASEVLSAHLEDCEACERTATNFDCEPDTLVELLQADMQDKTPSKSRLLPEQPSVNQSLSLTMPKELGQYELKSRLGTGGMGAVYLARHKSLNKQVAIKLLPALPAQNAEFVARFQREMRAAGQLDHPAIVRTTDAGEQQGVHFLVMEAVDGMNLSSIARAEEKLTVADACEVIRQASIGLAHAHEKGIVHRDVKPSNLMLNTSGKVLILDFGLAQVGFWDTGSAEITTVGQLMGTLDYMAPEQAERGGAVDYRADLYSLGATLFRLLTGRAPLAAAPNLTPLDKLRLLATHKPPKLRSLRNDVPELLGEIVDAILAREPGTRPASATHAAELLEPFAKGADLESLLRRARSKPDLTSDLAPMPPFLLPIGSSIVEPNASIANAGQSRSKRSGGGWLTWLAVAGCMAMFAAGIAFVIETSKGQLVIDSEADVQVKITKVDDDGEPTEVDELQIEPGTKTTRLRSGKYTITLDAPSDSFGITNGSFTIRSGQTIVATVTQKTDHSLPSPIVRGEGAELRGSEQPETLQLPQIVYDGKTLDAWLEQLKFERNAEQIKIALDAINALSSNDLRSTIEPLLVNLIAKSNSAEIRRSALEVLSKSADVNYPNLLGNVLNNIDDAKRKSQVFGASNDLLIRHDAAAILASDELWNEVASLLRSDDQQIVEHTARILRGIADHVHGESAIRLQQGILEELASTAALQDQSFWLAYPAGFDFVNWSGGTDGTTCAIFSAEIVQRAIAVISKPESIEEVSAQALIVLRTFVEAGNTLSAEQRAEIGSALKSLLEKTIASPDEIANLSQVPKQLEGWVYPSTSLILVEGFDYAIKVVSALNLIKSANLTDQLRPTLEELFEHIHELPLAHRVNFNRFNEDGVDKAFWDWHKLDFQERRANLNRFIYLQSGELLGKSADELLARFDEKLPADIELETNEFLDQLESSDWRTSQRRIESQFKLQSSQQVTYPDRALELIEKFFTQHASEWPTSQLNMVSNVWMQAAGVDFLPSYASAIKNADDANRERMLSLEFDKLSGFQCNEPALLQPLLEWCDETVREVSDPKDNRFRNAIDVLLQLSLKSINLSENCQRAIVNHLRSYSMLSNENFWFTKTIAPGEVFPYAVPILSEVLQRAIEQIKEDTSDSKIVCKALSILISNVRQIEQLDTREKDTLTEALRKRLSAAAQEPAAHSNIVRLNGSFSTLGPQFDKQTLDTLESAPKQTNDVPTNSNILVLNLIQALQHFSIAEIADRLVPEIEKLHSTIEHLDLIGPNVRIDQSWVGNFQRSGENRRYESILHAWYVQTGSLLGKDANVLNQRPRKFYEEELERRQRFIQPIDTLSVHIPGVLPLGGEPPVIQAGTLAPVVGFPIPVSENGQIQLPFIEPITVEDLELEQVKEAIEEAYVSNKVLSADHPLGISVQFLLRAGQELELRNIAGNTSVAVPPAKAAD